MPRRWIVISCLGIVALLASACSGTSPTTTARANGPSESHVYIAIGEDGSGGFTYRGDLRSMWAQIFYRSALGTSGTFYDYSMPDETAADALQHVLPGALQLHPDLVTIWLGTADIVVGTSPSVYGQELEKLVEGFRREGAVVLVANVAPRQLDPALETCQAHAAACGRPGVAPTALPPSSSLIADGSAYDGVIDSVAQRTGAHVVKLGTVLTSTIDKGGLSRLLTSNDMSLSQRGADLVAHAFESHLPRRFEKQR
jgi:lysophospholipase L1-like esterase